MADAYRELSRTDLSARAIRLGFRPDDLADLSDVVARALADPALLTDLDIRSEILRGAIGRIGEDSADPWEGLSGDPADEVRALLALLITVDDVRAFHTRIGVAEETSWRSLSDLGQQVFVHRLTYGRFGLHTYGWLRVAWSGALFWLGRLQFNLQRDRLGLAAAGRHATGGDASSAASGADPDAGVRGSVEAGEEESPGDAGAPWVLSTHVPRTGPLTPAEVDASFAEAVDFFDRHFPELAATTFVCHSWLLDPQLAEGLAEDSNMAQFQRRWRLIGDGRDADADALFFTFSQRGEVELDTLPQDTSLQRLIVERLHAGRHWRVYGGVVDLAPYRAPAVDRSAVDRSAVDRSAVDRHAADRHAAGRPVEEEAR